MSVDKAEFKKAVAHEIGVRLDDMLEAAEREVCGFDGARQALSKGAKAVADLQAHVDKDIDEGKFNDLEGPLQVAEVVKRYIQRASNLLENLQMNAEASHLRAQGKMEGLKTAITVPKKLWDEESKKIEAAEKPAARGTRAVGQHPGDPLAGRRASKKKTQKKASRKKPVGKDT